MFNKLLLSSIVAFTVLIGVLGTFQVDAMTTLPPFAVSILRLPNGILLTTQKGDMAQAKWKDIEVSLQLLGVSPQHSYGQSVVGNHSQIISQKFISTPNGKAWFALNERTPPAASHSTKATYEYWVAMERTSSSTGYHVDYCIEATVVGKLKEAKLEVLQLIANWKVPSNAENLTSYIEAPSFAPSGSTIWVFGWLNSANKKTQPITIVFYKDKEPNSGLGFETTLRGSGTFSTSILIPKNMPNGDYRLIVYDYSADGNKPILQKGIYIAPIENAIKPPKKIPVLNIWANPPLVGTKLLIDGWVPKGINKIKFEIDNGKLELQHVLTVRSNGYFEAMILLPVKMNLGKTEFVIRETNNHVMMKKSVIVAKSEPT